LTRDILFQFGNVPVGLRKVLMLPLGVHGALRSAVSSLQASPSRSFAPFRRLCPAHLVLGLRKIASNDSKMLISAGEA
jgi:hypothetical protein